MNDTPQGSPGAAEEPNRLPLSKHRYQTVTVHPPDENGACEVWGEYQEECGGRTFDSDGIIGWLYRMPVQVPAIYEDLTTPIIWVWLNEAGHPTHVFQTSCGQNTLLDYLVTLAPVIKWADEMKT
jgi:hypothetical protein